MHPAITYSVLVLCAVVFFAGLWVDTRREGRLARLRRFALVAQLASIGGAYLVLRPGSGVNGGAAIQASLTHGRPILLDYFSNY